MRDADALALRYDGPIPPLASVPHHGPDHLRENKRLAWEDVRRIGHMLVAESRMLRETVSMTHYEEWKRLRIRARRALNIWAIWRDEVRAMEGETT